MLSPTQAASVFSGMVFRSSTTLVKKRNFSSYSICVGSSSKNLAYDSSMPSFQSQLFFSKAARNAWDWTAAAWMDPLRSSTTRTISKSEVTWL